MSGFANIQFDVTQEMWGHNHPYDFKHAIPTVVEVHHAVIPKDRYDAYGHARAIQALHIGKGWNGVFYNVGVHSTTGEIVELRGAGNVSTQDAPNALTVVLFGDHHAYPGHEIPDTISPQAIQSLLKINALSPNPSKIYGHRERPYATACPGSYTMDHFLAPYRAGTLTSTPSIPPQTTAPRKQIKDMPYALAKHEKNNTVFALFDNGAVRSIGPGEKHFFDVRKVPLFSTKSDAELDRWRAAARQATDDGKLD